MSTHLITGYAGKEHITSADQGSFNAAIMGNGEFVLERGEQFRCQVISNNKVRIFDGDALMQGRHIIIDRNTYEETTHENGTQGYKRIDLIVLTYEKNATTGVESVTLDVIKGTPAESNPSVPEYVTGDIVNSGELKNQMPLYKVPFDGLSIGTPEKMFQTVTTLETMKESVETELNEKFSTLEASVDEKIAEAGKPLSSSAEDWGMIENYGEYSADAKTVGEEFEKVNSSLVAEDNTPFRFGVNENGEYGYIVTDGEGADTVIPFSSKCNLAFMKADYGSTEKTFTLDFAPKHFICSCGLYTGDNSDRVNILDLENGNAYRFMGKTLTTDTFDTAIETKVTFGNITNFIVGGNSISLRQGNGNVIGGWLFYA